MDFFDGKQTIATQIIGILRIPKLIKAIIAGSCLAISGMFMQAITKNPLVEPYITGVSSGAGLAIVVCILLGLTPVLYTLFGFVGAIIACLLVVVLSGASKFSITKIILIGLSINIFISSIISSIILIADPEKTKTMLTILSGNLSGSVELINLLLVLFVIGLGLSFYLVPKMNFLTLDRCIVGSINKNANTYMLVTLCLSAFLAALSVTTAGILGFIGIIIPHLSRILIGQDFKISIFTNILLGSSILLISDFLARNLIYPSEIPLGLLIAIIGCPIFIGLLVLRGKKLYA